VKHNTADNLLQTIPSGRFDSDPIMSIGIRIAGAGHFSRIDCLSYLKLLKMKKPVLFIHGAGEGAYKEDEKLVASLRRNLGPDYDVHYPTMENEADPDYETWVGQIRNELASVDEPVILVGHSVGASILAKFLSEYEVEQKISGVFLIAAPFWGGDKGWKYDGFELLQLPPKDASKFPEFPPMFFYHSHDDETVPFDHLQLYAERFPNGVKCELYGRGHQLRNDLSEVAGDIKTV
jgi:predicted alpha/beta hydrolase family esterase